MSAINPPQAVTLDEVRVGDVVTIESGDDDLTTTVKGHVLGVAHGLGSTDIQMPDLIRYSLGDGSDWRYVAGYRPTPEVEPGMTGTATVCGAEGVRVVTLDEGYFCAVTRCPTCDGRLHDIDTVTSFVPDAPAALRAEVERLARDLATTEKLRLLTEQRQAQERARADAAQPEVERLRSAAAREKIRADVAEARLARVTEHAIANAIIERYSSFDRLSARGIARAVLALVADDAPAVKVVDLSDQSREQIAEQYGQGTAEFLTGGA